MTEPTFEWRTWVDEVAPRVAPEGHWKMDETAGTVMVDDSGHDRDGAYSGGFTLLAPALSPAGGTSVELNGTTGGAVVPYATFTNPEGDQSNPFIVTSAGMTLHAFVQIDTPDADRYQVIADTTDLSLLTYKSWYLFWDNRSSNGSPRRLRFASAIGDTGVGTTVDWQGAAARDAVQAGGMVSVTVDSWEFGEPTTIRLFWNGVEVASAASSSGNVDTGRPLRLGRSVSTTLGFLDGRLDEVAIYSYAQTPAEVLEHFTAGLSRLPDIEDGWVVDENRTEALVTWSVTSGRPDANARTQPVQATVALADALTNCPSIGERFRLTVLEDSAVTRFTGEVTDPVIDPKRGLYTITAVGRLGRANRRPLSVRGWPTELDGARVARILTEAAPDVAGTIDAGTALVIKPTDKAPAGALLDLVSDSTLGQVVEQLDGTVDWHDAEHRRGATPVLTLDDSEILNTLIWAQRVGDVVNEADVTYGDAGASIRVRDPASIDDLEPFPASVTTALADASDAQSLGSLLVSRRAEPVWQLPQLQVDLWRHDPDTGDGVDAAKRAQLLALAFGDRLTVTGIPEGSPYAETVDLFLEGLQESVHRVKGGLVWRLGLSVSDPRLSGVSLRWLDLDDLLQWQDVDPTLRWLDVATAEDPDLAGTPDTATDTVDGGSATTTEWDRTVDGGTPTTTTWTDTIDGGTP